MADATAEDHAAEGVDEDRPPRVTKRYDLGRDLRFFDAL